MTNNKSDFWLTILRALIGRCPNCGEGRLFASYLKQVERCPECGENFGHIRADDGPAWLTIITVGHIIAPMLIGVSLNSNFSVLALVAMLCSFALVLTLAVLPRAKGVFIALIWRTNN